MSPCSLVGRSDTDAAQHDAGKTPPGTLTREHASTVQIDELTHNHVLGTDHHTPKTPIEHDEIASRTPELNPSQRAGSKAGGLDGWHEFPGGELTLSDVVSSCCSSEINDLSGALENRLTLSQQPSTSADDVRASRLRWWLDSMKISDSARIQCSHSCGEAAEEESSRGVIASGDAHTHLSVAQGHDNLVHCFVHGCDTKKPFISILL
jgi:hypothetical protein